MRRNLHLMGSAAIGLALAVQGIPEAVAQDADDSASGIPEIVITARKRSENLQETPLSVSAFTSDMIERANIKTLDDLAKLTPGFSFDEDFGRSASDRPVIRGQSTILGASGVSTFVDGVLITGNILDYDLGDVERIEIIKGPQSALYGRNTYSGAISIITKSPTDELSGRIKVEGAEFNQFDISASIRGPLTDRLSGSLTARFYDRGGPFTNEFDGAEIGQQRSKSISGVLNFQASDTVEVRARVRWSELDDDQLRVFTTDPTDNNCFTDIGGVYLGNGRYFCGEITEQAINVDDVRLLGQSGFDKSTRWENSLTIDAELSDNMTLTWVNGYNRSSFDSAFDFGGDPESLAPFAVWIGPFAPATAFGIPLPGFWIDAFVLAGPVADFASVAEGDGWDYSSELRLDYSGDGWDALLGGYFFKSSSESRGTRTASADTATIIAEAYELQLERMEAQCDFFDPAFPCLFAINFDPSGALEDMEFPADRSIIGGKRENLAVFGMLSKDLSEDFTISAEGRYQREEITQNRTIISDVYNFSGNFLRTDTGTPSSRKASFNSFNPRFTMKYAASENSNLYFVAARGNKPGGLGDPRLEALGLDTFNEESVWSYEVGSKNVLMDGQMIFNLAIFRNTISGYQLTQSVVIPVINQTTTAITNVGKVRLKGIELDAIFAPDAIPGLVLNFNYALTDSNVLVGTDINEGKLNDVLDDGRVNCSLGTADPAQPVCDSVGDNTLPGSIVGRRLPRQAKTMWNLGLNYTRPISDNYSLVINGNLSHESKKFVQVHNLAWVGSATLLSASIGIQSDSLKLTLWGKNITKEDTVVSATRFADASQSFQRVFLGNPRIGRQFGGTITQTF